MLIRFLQACPESKQLYEQFFFSIYKPLHQSFDDGKAAPIADALGRVLDKWSSRLEPGARFSKLPVVTGRVKLFCFPFQMEFSKLLKILQ